jgi:antitoxin (DNA-binding transcriptional repressor) of toxin-antitoxin stability system
MIDAQALPPDFAAWLDPIARGSVMLTRDGIPVARLVPFEPAAPREFGQDDG